MKNCRFCSVVSQSSGEDPIGSAGTYESYLIVEAVPPWPINIWIEPKPMPPRFTELFAQMPSAQKRKIRRLAMAPDREYSRPGYTRVLYYYRPSQFFAQFQKQEFLVPDAMVDPLILALFRQPELLSEFEPYRQPTDEIRDILVCTHGNVDVACSRFGYPIYKQLREEYAGDTLRVWRCSHFGGHQFAPTLIDLPEGRYWGHLKSEILAALIYRNVSISELRPFYRGWAGLAQYEQILERELWMQCGWEWINYLKAGQTLAIDTDHEDWNADWAEVRIDFVTVDASIKGAYEARVEVSHQVTTMWQSGNEQSIAPVKQYRVGRLVKTV